MKRIELEAVPLCPSCGANGTIVLKDCLDFLCDIPGRWTYRQCQQCNSLWLDPRPTKQMIPLLYPHGYYTHERPLMPFHRQGVMPSAKLAILEQFYGYTELSQRASSRLGTILGNSLGFLPKLSRRSGYTVRFLPHRPQGRLLDVGSGNGAFLQLMSELGWEVVGIEPDCNAAKVAISMGLPVMQGTIEDVELEPRSYDAVTLHHVLEHLPDPKEALTKLAACLKIGGVLVSISPNPVGLIARRFRDSWRGLEPPRHFVLPSPEGYKCLLENLGFRVNIWTTMQTSFWMLRESTSIRQTGHVGHDQRWLWPKVFSFVGSNIVLPLFPDSGEEVVCVAVKI